MHAEALKWIECNKPEIITRVIEFGSAQHGEGSVRDVIRDADRDMPYAGYDICNGVGVNKIHDCRLPLVPKELADLVVCAEVFEHVRDWGLIVANAWHCLIPGGWFLVTAATAGRAPHSCIRPGPPLEDEWYSNILGRELELCMEWCGFHNIRIDYDFSHADVYAIGEKR